MSDIRRQWEALRGHLEEEAQGSKQSAIVHEGLSRAYAQLAMVDKETVNMVLSEYLLTDDLSKRYDARALVRRFKIVDAMPALLALSAKLRSDPSATARKELELISEIIGELADDSAGLVN